MSSLALLAGITPPWTLTGGGALAVERAIKDAPRKDGGFSGPTLSWLLGQLPLEQLGATAELVAFRDTLLKRLLAGPTG
ncbi:MAG: hypothetical protein Q8S73_00260 [Deltaproteobacteria bacterium]|nr:hypothetical protein [Myxococcales bacterium]MDP3212504.1 hypothetical protein [Deltaproteobacteria bacterium]